MKVTREDFWNIIEKVHRASKGDMDKKCELLDAELRKLGLQETREFHDHFDNCFDRAYTYNLWAAAYIIGGGCSDDAFSDFRSTLISMGQEVFENTLADPESLAEINYDPELAFYEGYQYVPTTVETEMNGGQLLPLTRPSPDTPSGEPWEEANVAQIYPRLASKYMHAAAPRKAWWKFW